MKNANGRTLALMVTRAQHDALKQQIREREAKELRRISVSDAVRESLLRNGYRL